MRMFGNKRGSEKFPLTGGPNTRGNANGRGNLGQNNDNNNSSWNSTRRYKEYRPRPNFNNGDCNPRGYHRRPFSNYRGRDNRRTPRVNYFLLGGQWNSRWKPPRWRQGNPNRSRWGGRYRSDRNNPGGVGWQRSRGPKNRGPYLFNEK